MSALGVERRFEELYLFQARCLILNKLPRALSLPPLFLPSFHHLVLRSAPRPLVPAFEAATALRVVLRLGSTD